MWWPALRSAQMLLYLDRAAAELAAFNLSRLGHAGVAVLGLAWASCPLVRWAGPVIRAGHEQERGETGIIGLSISQTSSSS